MIFASVAEPANVQSDIDRRDHRLEVFVFGFGLVVVVAASIGVAFLIKEFVNYTLTS